MITRKEMDNVNQWARTIEYPGYEYSKKALERILSCLEDFHKHLKNNRYEMTFSNNEQFVFEFLEKNLCHMLGIDFKNICHDLNNNYRREILGISDSVKFSSYDVLLQIAENFDKVLEYDRTSPYRVINYYKLAIKADIFKKLPRFEEMNFGCINELSIESNSPTKKLYFPSDELISPYFMLGIISDEKVGNYVVHTLLAPENYINIFKNNEVSIPVQILIDSDQNVEKINNTSSSKLHLIKDYLNIMALHNLEPNLNVTGDYVALLTSKNQEETAEKRLIK